MTAADAHGAIIDTASVARAFVEARQTSRALPGFPGPVPQDLQTAYQIQDAALRLWPDAVAGWKLGRINPPDDVRLGASRVAGPIFRANVWPAGQSNTLPLIAGGFAAVEGEFILRLGRDAPRTSGWTPADAASLVDAMFIGVEFAASPLATINALGPTVVASDFGNNAGLIVGPEVHGWRERPFSSLHVETFIDGQSVGRGGALDIPGGPTASLAFLLDLCAARGIELPAGTLVSTGAATGVHDIRGGQSARISFGSLGDIHCHAVETRPATA